MSACIHRHLQDNVMKNIRECLTIFGTDTAAVSIEWWNYSFFVLLCWSCLTLLFSNVVGGYKIRVKHAVIKLWPEILITNFFSLADFSVCYKRWKCWMLCAVKCNKMLHKSMCYYTRVYNVDIYLHIRVCFSSVLLNFYWHWECLNVIKMLRKQVVIFHAAYSSQNSRFLILLDPFLDFIKYP